MHPRLAIALLACALHGCAYLNNKRPATVTPDDRICGTRRSDLRAYKPPPNANRGQVVNGKVVAETPDQEAFPGEGGVPVVRCYNNHFTP